MAALHHMPATQPQAHPDAQATVTDFLDYTEFYPSDLLRSLTLIGKLDEQYHDATSRVHELTKLYGILPTLPAVERPDPQSLRKQIAQAMSDAEHAREASFAEASRLYDNTDRHAARLITIRKKLQALPEPPSRDPTPVPLPSPQQARTRKPDSERTPRITLHFQEPTPRPRPTSTARVQKHRERKRRRAQAAAMAVVPGQVLPERNVNSPQPSTMSEWDDDGSPSPSDALGELNDAGADASGVKLPKIKGPKFKGPKTPRAPRPPGVMGTNVHSQVAGISTSNALAQLTPPPLDAKPGSKHAPWHKLTEYEMAVLRKTMKKNAIWQPSDTMIRRELSSKGRGWENYKKAREHAEETGEPLLDESPMDPNKEVLDPGETSFKPLGKDDNNLINRGMKLNEMKKLKREAVLREQAARDAMEIEDASRRVTDASAVIKNLFDGPAPTTTSMAKDKSRSARKRKRDSSPEVPRADGNESTAPPLDTTTRPSGPKKLKLAPPAPPKGMENGDLPSPTTTKSEAPSTSQVPLAPAGPGSSRAPSISPTRNQTPVLTSPGQVRNPSVPPTTAAGSRSRRTSVAPKAGTPLPFPEGGGSATPSSTGGTVHVDAPANAAQTRPRSRGGTSTKAASAEPPAKRELRELRELRRGSNVSLPSPAEQQNAAHGPTSTPVPGTRSSGRRAKRPAPGPVTADEDGRNKVVLGKRKAAPKKKGKRTEGRNDAPQPGDEMVEEIDPNEPRYCLCGDVSYGTMIGCENEDNCEREWFHLACVGLTEIPKRREKWYCPECRVNLHIDQKGNAVDTASGKRR